MTIKQDIGDLLGEWLNGLTYVSTGKAKVVAQNMEVMIRAAFVNCILEVIFFGREIIEMRMGTEIDVIYSCWQWYV
jgi:hypothetical protein